MGVIEANQEQFAELLAAIQKKDEWRADQMPDEASALRVFNEAFNRLKEFGWREAMYAPKHERIQLIECGSTGIHHGQRSLHDGDDGFWIMEAGDLWPSRAVLFRTCPAQADTPAPEER